MQYTHALFSDPIMILMWKFSHQFVYPLNSLTPSPYTQLSMLYIGKWEATHSRYYTTSMILWYTVDRENFAVI